MYDTLVVVQDRINIYSTKYPYIFQKYAELCNFGEYGLGCLESQGKRDMIQIDAYFSKSFLRKGNEIFKNLEEL